MSDESNAVNVVGAQDPTADLLRWAATRPMWQQDALRRLAIAGRLTDADRATLLSVIRKENGLEVEADPPATVPLARDHLGAGGAQGVSDTRLLAIHEVRHVGRMAADAHLGFRREGLSAIYGDNGAGKSGYTRILRRAGSGRGDDLKKKILPDIFGDVPAGDASAIFDIERAGAVTPFNWSAAAPDVRIPGLTVFDAEASLAYVDAGNAIELLPFNLDTIQGLIELCDAFKIAFAAEAKVAAEHLAKTRPQVPEGTQAAAFVAKMSVKTTSQEIADTVTLSPERTARLQALKAQVAAPMERLKTLTMLSPLLEAAAPALATAESALSDAELEKTRIAHLEAGRLRQVASDLNAHLLEGYDLPVGSDVWREMWEAARQYAGALVHPGHPFPDSRDGALCPLCQQSLGDIARDRFQKLEQYVSAKVQKDADEAAAVATQRIAELGMAVQKAGDALAKLDLSREDATLATDLAVWSSMATARQASMEAWFHQQGELAPAPTLVAERLTRFAADAKAGIAGLTAGANIPEAIAAANELRELEAWAVLDKSKAALEERVHQLARVANLEICSSAVNTNAITKFFNAMKERCLTDTLLDAYRKEISSLRLARLKVKVTPKNDRNAAKFVVDLDGRKHTGCKLSEVLSEGERRALSLAAFLAEQSIGEGSGCLVFDDPVSSLDHEWAAVIAKRLCDEAARRQIIVFTHDLVFYDKLCTAAKEQGIALEFRRLFRRTDTGTAGHVDPVRSDWNSQKVKDRLADLKGLIAKARPVASTSPAQYVFDAKGIYGRMRDTWERLIEELLFGGVVQRFQKSVSSQRLRYLTANPAILARIDAGMTRTSTFSHDNPTAPTDPIPGPDEMEADLTELSAVAECLRQHHKAVDKH